MKTKPDFQCKVNYVTFYGASLHLALQRVAEFIKEANGIEESGAIHYTYHEQSDTYSVSFPWDMVE